MDVLLISRGNDVLQGYQERFKERGKCPPSAPPPKCRYDLQIINNYVHTNEQNQNRLVKSNKAYRLSVI